MRRAIFWISGLAIGALLIVLSVTTRVNSLSAFESLVAFTAALGCPFILSFVILKRTTLLEVRIAMLLFNIGFSMFIGVTLYLTQLTPDVAQAGLILLIVPPIGFLAILFLGVIAAVVADFRGNVR